MRRLLGATAAALFVGLLPVPWAPAQPPTPDDELVFGELLNVELVLVDLLAEYKSGDPVLDLARDEIQVFEDGAPVEIVEFSAPTAERRSSAEAKWAPSPRHRAPGWSSSSTISTSARCRASASSRRWRTCSKTVSARATKSWW